MESCYRHAHIVKVDRWMFEVVAHLNIDLYSSLTLHEMETVRDSRQTH